MRSDIMGFRQDLLIKYELDMIDALLLDYITKACASNKMKKIHDENEQTYVWLQHEKIHKDLPIINLKEDTLKKRIHALVDKGMLKTILRTDISRGRRAFYTITELCEDLRMTDQVDSDTLEHDDQVDLDTLDSARPSGFKYTSDNKLNSIIDNKLDIDNNTMSIQSKDIDNFVSDYHMICKSLPRCTVITDTRRSKIKKILKKYSKTQILQVFNNLESSDFCKGNNDRGWKANIDFILREDKFVSVLEGKYNNSGSAQPVKSKDKFNEFGVVKSIPVNERSILNEAF